MNSLVFKVITLQFLHVAHCSLGIGLLGYRNRYEFYEKQNFNSSKINVTERWIEQPLDHFDPNEKRNWSMLFYECKDHWKSNGPIHIFIGGEGKLEPDYMTYLEKMAQETSGALFSSEHRYYGTTLPIDLDNSTGNYKYLSSKQALADVATLVKSLKEKPEFKMSKVVVHGRSYAGNLAAWMRLLYPDLIDAAVSESGPVLAKVNFYEFAEKTTEDIKKYCSQDSYDKIKKTFDRYEELFKTQNGIEQLKKENDICEDIDMKRTENQYRFFDIRTEYYYSLAQFGTPEWLVKTCNDTSLIHLIDKNSKLTTTKKRPHSNNKSDCKRYYDFDEYVNSLKLKRHTLKFWIYQTCTEFGYFTTTSTDRQIFGKKQPVEYFYKICVALFGPEFNEQRVKEGVKATNKLYGGLKPNVTKVVFINGDMDPWSKLSILEDLSPEAPAIVVPDASHCPYDLVEQKVIGIIKKWIEL